MAYPSITPLNGVKESTVGKIVKAEFDGNYSQQRLKTTRFRKNFEMDYLINASEFSTLDNFFQSSLGSSFDFTHPTTSTVYTVRFAEETLQVTYLTDDLIKVNIKLEEV